MKNVIVLNTLAAALLLLSACGKTNFSSTDQSTALKSGVSEETAASTGEATEEANGQVLQEIVDDPSLAELHSCGNKKVLICHVPPGNPAAAHTLCISENSVAAHIAHAAQSGEADTLGDCTEEKKQACAARARR